LGQIVHRVRMAAIVAGSALMGIAGAFLTLSAFNAVPIVCVDSFPTRNAFVRVPFRANSPALCCCSPFVGSGDGITSARSRRSLVTSSATDGDVLISGMLTTPARSTSARTGSAPS